jgi:dTDP-4-dehydrorhamnose 3,5-epimerase
MLVNNIQGLNLTTFDIFKDARGTFSRIWENSPANDTTWSPEILQVSSSRNLSLHTLRGLHGLSQEAGERKFVSCISGSIYDVVVDFRVESETYLDYYSIILSEGLSLSIPPGCLHGYLTLEHNSNIIYLMTAKYAPSLEIGLNFADPKLGITWPALPKEISNKDARLPFFDRGR